MGFVLRQQALIRSKSLTNSTLDPNLRLRDPCRISGEIHVNASSLGILVCESGYSGVETQYTFKDCYERAKG